MNALFNRVLDLSVRLYDRRPGRGHQGKPRVPTRLVLSARVPCRTAPLLSVCYFSVRLPRGLPRLSGFPQLDRAFKGVVKKSDKSIANAQVIAIVRSEAKCRSLRFNEAMIPRNPPIPAVLKQEARISVASGPERISKRVATASTRCKDLTVKAFNQLPYQTPKRLPILLTPE